MKFCLKIKILKGKFIQVKEIIKNKTFEVKEKERLSHESFMLLKNI